MFKKSIKDLLGFIFNLSEFDFDLYFFLLIDQENREHLIDCLGKEKRFILTQKLAMSFEKVKKFMRKRKLSHEDITIYKLFGYLTRKIRNAMSKKKNLIFSFPLFPRFSTECLVKWTDLETKMSFRCFLPSPAYLCKETKSDNIHKTCYHHETRTITLIGNIMNQCKKSAAFLHQKPRKRCKS